MLQSLQSVDHPQTARSAADKLKETSSFGCVAAMTLWRCNVIR